MDISTISNRINSSETELDNVFSNYIELSEYISLILYNLLFSVSDDLTRGPYYIQACQQMRNVLPGQTYLYKSTSLSVRWSEINYSDCIFIPHIVFPNNIDKCYRMIDLIVSCETPSAYKNKLNGFFYNSDKYSGVSICCSSDLSNPADNALLTTRIVIKRIMYMNNIIYKIGGTIITADNYKAVALSSARMIFNSVKIIQVSTSHCKNNL